MNINPSLEKLTISTYEDKQREEKKESFVVMFNPESYVLHYENVYSGRQGINTSGADKEYTLSKPKKLSLALIFDNTSVDNYLTSKNQTIGRASNALGAATSLVSFPSKYYGDVYNQVQRFLRLTSYMDSKSHEPRYLTIIWGDLIFECRLISVDIKYTLFNRGGQPLRAELNVVFEGSIKNSKRIRKENLQSPDMTHVREIKSGDTLPLMAQNVFSDPSYYIQLARVNKLNNFRRLKAGSTIKLPPIKK